MKASSLAGGLGVVALAAAPGLSACGGGGGGSGGGPGSCSDKSIDVSGCATVLSPGANDTKALQTALIDAKSGSTMCLCPGNYSYNQQITLTQPNVTLKGVGANIDDATLDFSNVATGGNDTMLVTADHFTAENFAVTNTPGNGVVVRQADSPTFRKLHVSWNSPDLTKHGAYAVYPAECSNVLVEYCEVWGAADASIYVGQGTGAILRHNVSHDSVLGLELENTTHGEAYDNEAYNCAGGMAVFLLPNLTKKTSDTNLVHDNNFHDNNHANFGDPMSVVSKVPVGTGVLVVGGSNVEIRNNKITNNESTGILVVSENLFNVLTGGAADPTIAPYPDHIFIHDNTFMGNGAMPQGAFTIVGITPLENVLWDGWVASGMPATNDAHFCLGSKSPWPSFRMFAGDHLADGTYKTLMSTDPTPYECDLTPIPGNPP
jgi:parallel beta-helix repeat protein